jgi:hypothetical protein
MAKQATVIEFVSGSLGFSKKLDPAVKGTRSNSRCWGSE